MADRFYTIKEKVIDGAIAAFTLVSCGAGIYLMIASGKSMKLANDTMQKQNKFYENANLLLENSLYYDDEKEDEA